MITRTNRVLLVDLNNFARYPTVPIGYLASSLRKANMNVDVFSPLALGVSGTVREPRPRPWGQYEQRLRYWSAVSESPTVRRVREAAARRAGSQLALRAGHIARELNAFVDGSAGYDVVLISTYLMYFGLCRDIAKDCKRRGIPVVIGGPYFTDSRVADPWRHLEGVAGVVGGEIDLRVAELVELVVDREDLSCFPGVWTAQCRSIEAPPFTELDSVPFPDYSDFPWDRYPEPIVPIITGRGCQWGACTFCSDVTSTAGRTYRTRSAENVVEEIRYQAKRFKTGLFVFTDLKLNSNLAVWHALIDQPIPDMEWVGSVHVDSRSHNGLTRDELRRARAAGLVRLTTGLESGSQRVLDKMCKGTQLELTSGFLRNAHDAGISVRTTMVLGYPGEFAADVRKSTTFLLDHADCLDRVSLNRFQIMIGTPIERRISTDPSKTPSLSNVNANDSMAQVEHAYDQWQDPDYRQAVYDLIDVVHRINRHRLSPSARTFEGVM